MNDSDESVQKMSWASTRVHNQSVCVCFSSPVCSPVVGLELDSVCCLLCSALSDVNMSVTCADFTAILQPGKAGEGRLNL